jgi:hypothetical protein
MMCDGDPLAIFQETVLIYQNAEDVDEDVYDDKPNTRDEICFWCKDRLAYKLDELREDLFKQLPFFFPLDPQATQD